MASITSANPGGWASGGTWVGGVVPIPDVDTAVVNHAVTVSTSIVVGNSPATNAAVLSVNNNGTSTNGSVTVLDGGTLTVRGGVTTAGSAGASAFVRVEAGGTLIGDSTLATAQVRYDYRMNGTSDYFEFIGVDGNRVTVTGLTSAMPNASGNPAALPSRFRAITGEPRVKGRFADLTDVGGATTTYAGSNVLCDFEDCTFNRCGTWYSAGSMSATAVWRFNRCKFTNSLAHPINMLASNTLKTSGVREVNDCVFDKGVGWAVSDVASSGNIIQGYGPNSGTAQTTGPGVLTDSLFVLGYTTSGSGLNVRLDNCYILGVNQSRNARAFAAGSTFGDPDANTAYFNRLIFDYPNISAIAYSGGPPSDGDTGDLIQTPGSNPASAITTTLANSIALPVSSGHSAESYASRGLYPGTMFTGRGFANTIMKARRNTWFAYDGSATRGSHGAINVAESTTSVAGTVPEFRDNLIWSDLTSGMPMTLDTSVTVDAVVPSGAHHNGSYNLITHSQSGSSNGKTYFGTTTGTIGVGDVVSTNPQFYDKDRCFVKWVRLLRGDLGVGVWSSGKRSDETYTDEDTITYGLAQMIAKLDVGFDTRYTVAALLDYVRDGFAPTNETYRFASSEGRAIGASDFSGVFAGDTFAGRTAGVSIAGSTASDLTSVWTAHSGDFKSNGAGGVYPTTGKFSGQLISIDNNLATQANQDIHWTWVPQADPKLTGGNGWSTMVAGKIRNAQFAECVFAIFDTASGSGGEIYLVENNAFGAFRRESTHSSAITSLTVPISCVLSIRAGVATLTCTGGVTFSTTLTLSITAGGFGGIGLMAYSPAGGVDATNGVHTGPITGSNYTAAATAYSIIPARDIYTNGLISYASKYPSAFAIANPNVGNVDPGYAGNRMLTLALDGVAPSGGFTFTPTAGSFRSSAGTPQATIVIPAGSDSFEFAFVPPTGAIADLAITGTNNAGYSNPSITADVRPKFCMMEGDSISSSGFGALWPAAVQTAIGTDWLFQTTAREYSQIDDGSASPTASVSVRLGTTVTPFRDGSRTQEALIIWAGTNDIYGGDSAATTYAALASVVAAAQAANIANIAVVTMLPRDGSAAVGGQSAMETRRQDYNTLIKAGYGSTGTDTSVDVLDIGSDATIGGASDWSNATYYPDGTHPQTSASTTIISGTYISPWIVGLPASQDAPTGLHASVLTRRISFLGGFSPLHGGFES